MTDAVGAVEAGASEEPEWITHHQCEPVWIHGKYTGIMIQVCAASKERGLHVVAWTSPTLEVLWAMQRD